MGKIVGKKYFFIGLLCTSLLLNGRVQMTINTIDGMVTRSAVVGQPFIVEVLIDGVQGSVQAPAIDGLEKFASRRTGMYMSTINGVSTTKYTYYVVIETPGEYQIGPARLMHQKKELFSEPLSIHVGYENAEQAQSGDQKRSGTHPKVLLRLSVDHDRVVVGQKIKATLRLYYQDSNLTLSHIGQPSIVGFDCDPISKPFGGATQLDKIQYRYVEWTYDLFPKESGELAIPAYSAEYELPKRDTRSFGSFFMFMGARNDRKVIYSNPVKILVDPLMQSGQEINGVGHFEGFNATITPAVAKEGEGMALVVEIAGNGAMKNVQLADLVMPSSLKCYNSHSTLIPDPVNQDLVKKRFEFIVQGKQAGEWEIPVQQFVYFDTVKHDYVTLYTSPLAVTIQPLTVKADSVVSNNNQGDAVAHSEPDLEAQQFIPILNRVGPWYSISVRSPIPLLLFLFLIIMPLFFIWYPLLYCYGRRAWQYMFGRSVKSMFRRARKKVNQCAQRGDGAALYALFGELFMELCHSPSKVSAAEIEQYIHRHVTSQREIDEWKFFFSRMCQAAYAQHNNENVYELCRMSIEWIDRLERYL